MSLALQPTGCLNRGTALPVHAPQVSSGTDGLPAHLALTRDRAVVDKGDKLLLGAKWQHFFYVFWTYNGGHETRPYDQYLRLHR